MSAGESRNSRNTPPSLPLTRGGKKRVLVALSGGIDSAVSAYKLIKEGYEVEAAFMKNWSSTRGLKYDECPWLTDRQDALRVAAFLKIPLHTIDFEKEYSATVMNYFFKEYKAGRTPNPDVMCNKEIKFKLLYDWAMKEKFDYLATGHYARIIRHPAETKSRIDTQSGSGTGTRVAQRKSKTGESEFVLQRSVDEFKDQTYFIYNIKTNQLPHILFPIGGMKKISVRTLAKKLKLPNADKKESMGLCFVGKIRLKDFLEQKLKAKRGSIIDTKGNVLGKHEGLHYYTLGQRQGINIGSGGPWYVAKKRLVDNTLVVTNNPKDKLLQIKELEIHSVNWVTPPNLPLSKGGIKLQARYRHQGSLENVTLSPVSISSSRGRPVSGLYKIVFSKPQSAVASGQSLVLYDKDICVGGGVIV